MLIAATPGDNAGLEFDLCRRNRRLPAAAGWVPSSKFVPPWGLCGLNLACCVSRGLGARVRGAAQDPCAVHAALTMNGPGVLVLECLTHADDELTTHGVSLPPH